MVGVVGAGTVALLLSVAIPTSAFAQGEAPRGRVLVTVVDQTGGVLRAARVTVTGDDEVTRALPIRQGAASEIGVATFEGLAFGRYMIEAEFAGFETVTLRGVQVRGTETRITVTLPVKKLVEKVTVGRDERTSGLDPRGDAFSTILTREQISALPDDPEELEAVLKAMAPPGAIIRVDGFTGGALPPKSQIRSIRLPRMDQFAAQDHGGIHGAMHIDIMTQPGVGPLRVTADFRLRDDALNARSPFAPSKGDEQLHRYGFFASSTLVPERSSFSFSATLTSQYDTDTLLAAVGDGSVLAEPVRRPLDGSSVTARFDQALGEAHTLRVNYQRTASDRRNLGIGGFNLRERGYSTASRQDALRISENGPIGRRLFTETRLQVQWERSESISAFEMPTIRVLDAFTSGGAQQRGGRQVTVFELATDLDYVRGNHAVRTGILLDGGRYRSDQLANYLGTYTFGSLDDYLAGRPRTFTRRVGDARVSYVNLQAGLYVQDDWRASRAVLVSAGVRYEVQTHTNQAWSLSPRASLSWSPFRSGHTTLRASAGYFHDWLDMTTFEQSLRVDGFRQQELQILDPAYPEPGLDGVVPPTNRYLLDAGRRRPASAAFSAGVDRSFLQIGRVSFVYTWRDNKNLPAGQNLNAPLDGVRPDPQFANVVEARSIGESRVHQINVGGALARLKSRRTVLSTNYTWTMSESNTSGAFSLPASGQDLLAEWGPVDPRHRFSVSFNTQLMAGLAVNVVVVGRSGQPYNVTTGLDDNLDGVFNDRPSGVRRNSARGAPHWSVSPRLTYSIGLGKRPDGGSQGNSTSVAHGGGDGGFNGGATNGRCRLDIYVSAENLLNRYNYVGYSGVRTSPFFGQPTNVANLRKIELGIRFGF